MSITVNAELHGLIPDTDNIRDLLVKMLAEETNTKLENVKVSLTVNDEPIPVLPRPDEAPQDCRIKTCYLPMPHTHGTDSAVRETDR